MKTARQLRLVSEGYVSVKELAARYGVSTSTLYELIRTDPTFPCRNVGAKKRFVIDEAEYEVWLTERDRKQKDKTFNLQTADKLLRGIKK